MMTTSNRDDGLAVTEQVLLGAHTTFGTGGPARFWATAATPDAVVQALGWAEARALPVVVLGGGSNVLVADRGLEALVLRVRTTGMLVHERAGTVRVVAGAGLVWDELVGWAVERGLAGIECLAGIPGEVGAAPVQNIGAYGQEVAECVEAVAVIDRATGARRVVAHAQCGFGYRHSAFKEPGQQEVIVSVTLRLRPGGPATMRYAELARSFERSGVEPGLAEVRATVLALRRGKSMVLDASDENRRSAGSFFVNPTLDADALARLRERAAAVLGPNESLPQHPAPNGATKVPAAWLIERAGLGKGFGQGAVGLSTRHTLAIVNRGGASSQDVLAFAGFVRQRVLERFGVGLVPEVRLLGFEPAELAAVGL